VFVGETGVARLGPWRDRFDDVAGQAVCILSSHDTLIRDCALAEWLRVRGHRVCGQSRRCATLAVDKIIMKRCFDEAGFRTPQWAHAGSDAQLARSGSAFVLKSRNGTQSAGTRLVRLPVEPLADHEFAEVYVDGVEYSVVAYVDADREFTLPVVWKGPTSPELVPPWRRLRVCPAIDISTEMESRLRSLTLAVAHAVGAEGFLEAEYIVDAWDVIHLLEINPRVAGTMRIAAMAADVPIFSLPYGTPPPATVQPTGYAVEVPYHGEPIVRPEHRVFATSRLTVAEGTLDAALARLADFGVRTPKAAIRTIL
jgi:carbamoylphosphate synthase large subunit